MISGDDPADQLQKNREILFEPKQEETSLDDSKMGHFDIYFNCAIKLYAPTYLLLNLCVVCLMVVVVFCMNIKHHRQSFQKETDATFTRIFGVLHQ